MIISLGDIETIDGIPTKDVVMLRSSVSSVPEPRVTDRVKYHQCTVKPSVEQEPEGNKYMEDDIHKNVRANGEEGAVHSEERYMGNSDKDFMSGKNYQETVDIKSSVMMNKSVPG